MKLKGIESSRLKELAGTSKKFSSLDCYKRTCVHCSTHKLTEKILAENRCFPEKEIFWNEWKKTGYNPHGEETIIPQKIEVEGNVTDCFQQLVEELEPHALHVFHVTWNLSEIEHLRKNVPEGVVVMYMDFAKNFDLQPAREIQSAYWDCTSVTIHGIVCFYRCTTEGCQKIVTDKYMHVTKEKKHDSFIPRVAMEQTINLLIKKGVPISLIVQACDNASD